MTRDYLVKNVTEWECQLVQKWDKKIRRQNEKNGTIYQVNSPRYFRNGSYPNNRYCIWNIANEGLVTYQIIDQQLQNASDCDGQGCDCPDTLMLIMGSSEVKLCGSTMPPMVNNMSRDGLQVKFCSDNMHLAKGFLLKAFTQNNQSELLNNNVTLDKVIENMARRKRREQICKCITTVCMYVYIYQSCLIVGIDKEVYGF